MADYTSLFKKAANAKALGGFASRLPIGSHTVLMKRFNVKDSAQNKGRIVEADFLVIESTDDSVMKTPTKGWAWFPDSAGWAGQYEESRLKSFIETVGACIGDDSGVEALGGALAHENQLGRGMMLKCVISPQTDRAGVSKKNAKGETYVNIEWQPVTQTLEDIQKARATLDAK